MSRKGVMQHNNVYRFISMKDKNVMEVPASSTSGMPVVVMKANLSNNQKFKGVQISPGEFQILSLAQQTGGDGDTLVWDFMPGDGQLIQNTASSGPNQSWIVEEIHPNSKVCLIKSRSNGRCCRNMGVGRPVELVAEDRRDSHQHWRLEATY